MYWILMALALVFSSAALADGPDLGDACTLAWDAPATGVVRGYRMSCSPDEEDGPNPLIFELDDVLTTTCAEMGLPSGHHHCKVTAFNNIEESEFSNDRPFVLPQLGNPSNLTVGP